MTPESIQSKILLCEGLVEEVDANRQILSFIVTKTK